MTINYVSPEAGDGPDPDPCNVIGPEGAHHEWCFCIVERADGERCMAPVGECPCEPTRQFRVTRHTESSQVVTLPAVWPANGEQSAAHDAEAVAEARGWVGADTESSVSADLMSNPAIAAALQPPHFHVLAGLPGLYMPDYNAVYATEADARAGLLEYVERNDQGDESDMEVSYQTVDHVQWSDGNFRDYEVYVETVCTEPECLTELDSA